MLTRTDAGRAGEPHPAATLADVARAAGMACSTVSRALNGGRASDETVARVQRAASSLGYRPSYIGRMLSSRRTESVAAVVASLDRSALVQALQALQREMALTGTSVTIVDQSAVLGEEADAALMLGDRDRFDGAALLGVGRHEGLASAVRAVPVASFGEMETQGAIDPVAVAVDHLRMLGHDRVLYVGVDADLPDHADYDAVRRSCFDAAAAAHGLQGGAVVAEPTVEGAYSHAVLTLVSASRRPTAVIAGTGEIAIGVMLAAQRLGIDIPGDLSVVSIEDHPSAPVHELTSVDVHAFARGAGIARRLTTAIATPGDEAEASNARELQPVLRVRHTTAVAHRPHDEGNH